MPRTARLNHPGSVFHVVSRFVRGDRLLDRPGARDAYLAFLRAALAHCDVQLLAYCLMSNHVHLVVVQGQAPLARFLKSVHTGFAGWVHDHRTGSKAAGPVFAQRPRSVLVAEDPYLLQLVRYVHNNPVRAKVARRARESAWSSHRAYVGHADPPAWLRIGYVLSRFGAGRRAAERFDAFVDEGRAEPRRPELSGAGDTTEAAVARRRLGDAHRVSDGVLGDDAFVRRIRADRERIGVALSSRGSERRSPRHARPTVRQVRDATLAALELDPIELEQRPKSRKATLAKRLILWIWLHEYGGHQIDVARMLALPTSAVSRHYTHAVGLAGELDELASAVVAMLARAAKRKGELRRAPDHGLPVRYHVDAEET